MYFSLFRKIAASLLAKTILIDTALASNPSKEQEFHPQRRKCRSMSKRNNSSERYTIGIVNGHLGVGIHSKTGFAGSQKPQKN